MLTQKNTTSTNKSSQVQGSSDLDDSSESQKEVAPTQPKSKKKRSATDTSALLVPTMDALLNKAVANEITSELEQQIQAQFSCSVSCSTLMNNHIVGTVSRKGKQKSGQLI